MSPNRFVTLLAALPSVTSPVTIDDEQDQLQRLPLPSEIIQQAIWLYVRFTLSL